MLLHDQAKSLVGSRNKIDVSLLLVLEKIEDQKIYLKLNFSSMHVYAVSGLGLSEHDAYNFLKVVQKFRESPNLNLYREAVLRGDISVAKARRIAPVIEYASQAEWLERAATLSQRALEKECARKNPKLLIPEKMTYRQFDRVELQCGISEELMKKIERTKDLLSQKAKRAVGLEEALEILFTGYIEKNDPVKKAERNEKAGTCRVIAIKAGKRTSIPANLKHAVHLRDQGRCVECGSGRWVEIHHKIPVSEGGRHELSNLVTLCGAHHKMAHEDLHRARRFDSFML